MAWDSASLKLGLDDDGVNGAAGVMHHGIGEEAHGARLHVNLHRGRLRAEGPGDGVRVEVGAGVQPGLARDLHGPRANGGLGETAERDGAVGQARDVGAALLDPYVLGGALAHSSSSAATRAARSRTSRAVCATAGPALAMTRPPPVPMPNGTSVVSPAETITSSKAAPSSWAQTWARVVAWPWPWAATPQDIDLAGGVHAHGGALEGPEPRALRIARDAHADAPRAVLLRGLAPAPPH